MRKLLFIAFNLPFLLFSQTITGKVNAANSDNPMEEASIFILEKGSSKVLAKTNSDAQGNYILTFNYNPTTEYIIRSKYIGYELYESTINSAKFPTKLNIELTSNSKQIKEVEIEAVRARATIKDDTIIYDAKAFKTHKDANVEDLVAKMPGVTKENGVIKAHGEEVKKVTVDGQDFFGEDANIALKNLPAETVDKVEIFDAMNDRNSFTGFNDGNTTKTMNLKTKAGKNKGTFGKAYTGYGTSDRYQMGGNYNYYNGSQRVAILGMSNNINNLNFSTSELVGAMTGSNNMGGTQGAGMMRGMNFGMSVSGQGRSRGGGGPMSNFTVSNQDGVNKAYSFGINYNDIWGQDKKVKTTLSYFGNRTDNFTDGLTKKTNFIDSLSKLTVNQNDINNSQLYKHKFSSRFDGILDARNSYVLTNKIEFNESNSHLNSQTTNFLNEQGFNLFNQNNTSSNSKSLAINSNFLYKLKFSKIGRTFSVNTIFDINDQDGISNQVSDIKTTSVNNNFGLDYKTKQWSTTLTNIITYTEPSGKFGQWLVNYSPSITNRINDRQVSTFDVQQPTPVLSNDLSNNFTNNLFYNVGGISYRLQYAKWRFMMGSNLQNINFEGIQKFPSSSELKRDFFGVLPYFNIQFNPEKMIKYRLQYSTSMNVPSIANIQPVIDVSNPTNIYKGNENLTNEYSHNLFFHFMKPSMTKGTFLIFVSNISYTQDKFSNYSFNATKDTSIDNVQLRRGSQYSKTVNLNNAYAAFIFGNYTFPVKSLKSNLSLNGNISHNQTPSVVNNLEVNTKSSMLSTGIMLTSNISENLDFTINYNPKYIINTFSSGGIADNNFWLHSIGSNMKATILKDFVWSYDFSYNYNTQIDASLNQHIFLLGTSLAYKFLKSKQLEAKLTIFDLFNQNRNLTRTVSNTTVTDSRINAMNQYGLFTMTYSFKKFEGRDPDKNSSGFQKMMHPKGKDD